MVTDEDIAEKLVLIDSILRHIRNVSDNCILLGKKLILDGQVEFGTKLIANGLIHDNSKLSGIELEYLHPDVAKTKLELAVNHHNSTNPHHPEYWQQIDNMPDIFLAEMACDWKSRSEEFGTSIYDWALEEAPKRFNFKKSGEVYRKILKYLELLCDKPFEKK